MNTVIRWQEKMAFICESGKNGSTSFRIDAKAPIGQESGPTPKELVAFAVSGCTAMDVAALMKKYKQTMESFAVEAEVTMKEGSQPAVFARIDLVFALTGPLDKEKVIEAVRLSQTKYCGVSAMMVKACPIAYKIILNGEEIGRGEAAF